MNNPKTYGNNIILLKLVFIIAIVILISIFTTLAAAALHIIFLFYWVVSIIRQKVVTVYDDKVVLRQILLGRKKEYSLKGVTHAILTEDGTKFAATTPLLVLHINGETHTLELTGLMLQAGNIEKHIRQNVELLQQQKQATIA